LIKVLYLYHKYVRPCSLQKQLVRLDPQRFQVTVCYLSGKDDGRNDLEVPGGDIIYLHQSKKRLRWYNFLLIRKIRAIIEENQIDVVNCQNHRTVPLGILATFGASNRPAVVATFHGLNFAKTFRRKIFNAFLFRKIGKIIGVSEGVKKDILRSNWGLAPEKVVTIHNGLSYDAFLTDIPKAIAREKIGSGHENAFVFGTVGRLSEVKNHQTLLKAFARVSKACPDCLLMIAGDGPLGNTLREQVQALGIENEVVFLGFRGDIPDVLKAFDVFVLPSFREGLPLSMLEAMASGLPIVASEVGGIPEVFGTADIGFLVNSRDVSMITKTLIETARLPSERLQDLGENARQRALENFSSRNMIDGYQKVYEELTSTAH
jgi:glycosyltransferase involved in cell wall biosynthesis